jgi:hypothetical protein
MVVLVTSRSTTLDPIFVGLDETFFFNYLLCLGCTVLGRFCTAQCRGSALPCTALLYHVALPWITSKPSGVLAVHHPCICLFYHVALP